MFLIWPVIEVVNGELMVEHKKMSQFNKNAWMEDMKKQNYENSTQVRRM